LGWLSKAGRWLAGTLPPPEFSGENPPDWLAAVRATCLPPGRVYSLRLSLWPDRASVAGSVWWGLLPFIRSLVPGSGAFPLDQAVVLLELAERAFDAPPPIQPVQVMDGMPCRVRLFRRQPFGVRKQSWNLGAWWPWSKPPAERPAMVQLAAELYSKSVKLCTAPPTERGPNHP
jgi:hypothetical protein